MPGRFEVAIRTPVDIWAPGKQPPPSKPLRRPTEPVAILFEGRTFTWFPGDDDHYPSVALPFEGDYEAERRSMQRFLSALSYHLQQPIRVDFEAAQGSRREDSPPLARASRRGGLILTGPSELRVVEDDSLRLCLALFRDAFSSQSPFYEFLGYYKVLEVVTGGDLDRDRWIHEHAGEHAAEWRALEGEDERPSDWAIYFKNSSRNAIAHALRSREDAAHIDPDDPSDQARLRRDARFLAILAKQGIDERWPKALKAFYLYQ
jgi:hypothetical protein